MYWFTKLAQYKTILVIVFALALSLAIGTVALAELGAPCSPNSLCGSGEVCSASGVCVAEGGANPEDTFGLTDFNTGVEGVLGNEELGTTVGRIINVALSLLGVVAVVIVLAGGFKWMTAGGNEEKTTEARKLIFAGIIGLAIILSAWAITLFVIKNLSTATGSGNIPTQFQ